MNALTVRVTEVEALRWSPGSVIEIVSGTKLAKAGLWRVGQTDQYAASRLLAVPVTVIEAEPFEPAVKVRPLVDPSVNVPWLTDSFSESALLPAAESATVIALVEKTSEESSLSEALEGAAIAGALAD